MVNPSAARGGQFVCFRQGYENARLLKPREEWIHTSSNVSECGTVRKDKHPSKKYYHLWVTGTAKFCKVCIPWDDLQYVCVCWISFCKEGVIVPSLDNIWFCLGRETSRGDKSRGREWRVVVKSLVPDREGETVFSLWNQSFSGCNVTGILICGVYVGFVQTGHSSRDKMEPGVGFWAKLHSYNAVTMSPEAEWV